MGHLESTDTGCELSASEKNQAMYIQNFFIFARFGVVVHAPANRAERTAKIVAPKCTLRHTLDELGIPPDDSTLQERGQSAALKITELCQDADGDVLVVGDYPALLQLVYHLFEDQHVRDLATLVQLEPNDCLLVWNNTLGGLSPSVARFR